MWKYIRFPNQCMILLSRNITDFSGVGPYIFRVSKSMSKLDIREYLTKIYNVKVTRVNTANYLGNGYRYSRSAVLKECDWKKAFVFIEPEHSLDSKNPENVVKEVKKEL